MNEPEPVFAIAPQLFNSLGIYIYTHPLKIRDNFNEASLEAIINQLSRMNFTAVKAIFPSDTDYWSGLKGYHFNLTAAMIGELAGDQMHLNQRTALQTLSLIRESVGQLHTTADTELMNDLEAQLSVKKSRLLLHQQAAKQNI